MKALNDWKVMLVVALTLGLAPFVPEPHIVGKIRWVLGGAIGMQPMDWFDLVLHGTPWILLFRALFIAIVSRRTNSASKGQQASSDSGKTYTSAALLIIGAALLGSCNAPPEHNAETADAQAHHEWDYAGSTSPEHWAELDSDFIKCAEGHFQSPIDIETYTSRKGHVSLEFNYIACPVNLINNGHTIQAVPDEANTMKALGKTYSLKQIHFHDPSEHRVDGIIYPMEVHMVHADSTGKLAVVGIFVKEGPPNDYLAEIWDALPSDRDQEYHTRENLEMDKLFPVENRIYHYTGSLTTPPCTEGVEWFIYEAPMTMSKAQIQRFQSIHPGNNRPIQQLDQHRVESLPS